MMNNPSPLAQLGSGMQQGNGLQLSGGFRQQPSMGGMPQMRGGFQANSPLAQLGRYGGGGMGMNGGTGMAQMSGGIVNRELGGGGPVGPEMPGMLPQQTMQPYQMPNMPTRGGQFQMPQMPQLSGGFRDGR